MIARITGRILEVHPTHIIVDVSGIGYLVSTRVASDFKKGAEVSLHTYLAVRENALDLYGFKTSEELQMFELLIKIPKIGPRSAMQIMSQADIALLRSSVMNDDPSYLSKMSGIGKKSAENIVVGLKDKLEYSESDSAGEATSGSADVVDALITLGYSQKDAREALKKLSPDVTDTNGRIKEALKHLGK